MKYETYKSKYMDILRDIDNANFNNLICKDELINKEEKNIYIY